MSHLTHPEDGSVLVDRLGNAACVGDTVIIARKSSRYGGAQFAEAVIKKITPLVIHPRHGTAPTFISTGRGSRIPLVREDQLVKSHQTEYLMWQKPDAPINWGQQFVASVEVPGMSRLHTVPFGMNLIVVPA